MTISFFKLNKPTLQYTISVLAACLAAVGVAARLLQFIQTGELQALFISAFYFLLLRAFISRPPSRSEATGWKNWALALGGTWLQLLVVTTPRDNPMFTYLNHNPELVLVGNTLMMMGLVLMTIVLAQLGNGFGIIAALREVKTEGAYRWVRHPLYTVELICFAGIILTALSPWNVMIFAMSLCFQFLRALREEEILVQDADYAQYMQQVKYRFLPQLF